MDTKVRPYMVLPAATGSLHDFTFVSLVSFVVTRRPTP